MNSAFDVVNIKLLLKRMRIAGLPSDIVKLVEIWLVERRFFVTVNGKNSFIKISDLGTVQGSILGPFLYALYVSPVFELTTFFAFADDKQVMEHNKRIETLIVDMERRLELMMKWLRQSGLVVNEEKTELCLFYKSDHPIINVTINNKLVTSKNQ